MVALCELYASSAVVIVTFGVRLSNSRRFQVRFTVHAIRNILTQADRALFSTKKIALRYTVHSRFQRTDKERSVLESLIDLVMQMTNREGPETKFIVADHDLRKSVL